ncbi:MAG: hypothetical protein R3C49_15595 [Planctomycetaceae bacterium]
MSVSLVSAALVTLAVYATTNLLQNEAQAMYFGTVTMLAACGLIIPSAEYVQGKPVKKDHAGFVGLGVGYVAAVLPRYLLIDHEALFQGRVHGEQMLVGRILISDGSGFPTIACFMTFFAGCSFCDAGGGRLTVSGGLDFGFPALC